MAVVFASLYLVNPRERRVLLYVSNIAFILFFIQMMWLLWKISKLL